MYLLQRFTLLLFTVILISGCNNTTSNNASQSQTQENGASLAQILPNFTKLSLPAAMPVMEGATAGKPIDNNLIRQLFGNSGYKPVFGQEKDVPDLADNSESAKYFSEGMFQTDGYTAIIIRKVDNEDTYYYLSTFNAEQQFIEGMCIAFKIGTEVERIASVNDDFSMQIRQTDKMAGEPAAESQNAFFEIGSDGRITPLNNGNTPV